MSELTELAAADSYCRLLAGRHYENFEVASRLLPAPLRLDLARVYAFCRVTDDLGDESGAEAPRRLRRWRDEVEAMFSGEPPVHPALVALRETVARHGLTAEPFLDLVAANLQDQEVTAYDTWPELLGYCRLSAAPVGRIVLRLFAVRAPEAKPLSDDVCIGLQLANFAQDVGDDAARGRCYLLRPEVEELGTAGAVRRHCERSRRLLASGRSLEELVSGRLRLQLGLYRLGGLAILRAIERAGFETARTRPRVSTATRAWLAARSLALMAASTLPPRPGRRIEEGGMR